MKVRHFSHEIDGWWPVEICGFDVMIFAEASLSSRSAVWHVHNPHVYNGPKDPTCEPEGSMYDKLGHLLIFLDALYLLTCIILFTFYILEKETLIWRGGANSLSLLFIVNSISLLLLHTSKGPRSSLERCRHSVAGVRSAASPAVDVESLIVFLLTHISAVRR